MTWHGHARPCGQRHLGEDAFSSLPITPVTPFHNQKPNGTLNPAICRGSEASQSNRQRKAGAAEAGRPPGAACPSRDAQSRLPRAAPRRLRRLPHEETPQPLRAARATLRPPPGTAGLPGAQREPPAPHPAPRPRPRPRPRPTCATPRLLRPPSPARGPAPSHGAPRGHAAGRSPPRGGRGGGRGGERGACALALPPGTVAGRGREGPGRAGKGGGGGHGGRGGRWAAGRGGGGGG